ncbi:hypothetical protein Bca101_060321 [Brassica carinata]
MMSKEEAKINQEMQMLRKYQAPRKSESFDQTESRKLLIVGIKPNIPDLNEEACYDLEEEEKTELTESFQTRAGLNNHDAGYVDPTLNYELKVEIFSRLSCFEHWKLQFLNKKCLQLLKSGDIFRVRKEQGLVKAYVIMHTGGRSSWQMFDKDFENFRRLPNVPSSDYTFFHSDKETISVGTQLIVIGTELEGTVVWRYELENHKWFRGPSMISPRVMYGSASWGSNAFFAGGIKMDDNMVPVVVSTVEKYNSDTKMWTMLNGMHKRRKFSSGCFLGGKFYVIGGRDENDENLTCGEIYDEANSSWELIPDMLKDITFMSSQSPPLIAVVEDNLYLLDSYLNELRVYDKNANIWKKLGFVPVNVNSAFGWGVAFKSIGDRLLLVGPSSSNSWDRRTVFYTCRPSPGAKDQHWKELKLSCNGVEFPQFIHNCSVMFA